MNAKNVDNDAALMISNPDAMPEVGVDNERGNIMWEIPIEVIATEDSDANAQQIARQARSFLHAQERRARCTGGTCVPEAQKNAAAAVHVS